MLDANGFMDEWFEWAFDCHIMCTSVDGRAFSALVQEAQKELASASVTATKAIIKKLNIKKKIDVGPGIGIFAAEKANLAATVTLALRSENPRECNAADILVDPTRAVQQRMQANRDKALLAQQATTATAPLPIPGVDKAIRVVGTIPPF